MNERLFADNPRYAEYERLLLDLHEYIAAGQGDTPAGDAIRENMEKIEAVLHPEELARLDGLSADLYMLNGQEIFEPANPPRDPKIVARDVEAAWRKGAAERTLALLHEGPALPSARVAHVRALAYEALGHRVVAQRFLTYAHEHGPAPVLYAAQDELSHAAGS